VEFSVCFWVFGGDQTEMVIHGIMNGRCVRSQSSPGYE
jgi:hypothetical protein